MACFDCPTAMHTQYEGEIGRWVCRKTDDESTICETPVLDCGNSLAHARALKTAHTPEWCPKNKTRCAGRR